MKRVPLPFVIAMPTYRELLQQTKAEISEVDAARRQALDGAVWVDVREADEWQEGHIPGAVHVPRGYLESRIEGVAPDKTRRSSSTARPATARRSPRRRSGARLRERPLADRRVHRLEAKRPRDRRCRARSRPEQRTRYSRHLLIPEIGEEGQLKLLDSRILLIGAGGLGSPASLYLAAAGIGTLGIIDADIVDETNLQRQIAHSLDTLGTPKVDSAKRAIEALNPDVERRHLPRAADVREHRPDPRRRLGHHRRRRRQLPHALPRQRRVGLARHPGRARVDLPLRGPGDGLQAARRPVLPLPLPGAAAARARAVVLRGRRARRAAGIVGSLQTNEAIKLAAGIGEPLVGRLLLFDALATEFNEVKIERRADCPVCGDHPTITEYIDYVEFCAQVSTSSGSRRCCARRRAARARSRPPARPCASCSRICRRASPRSARASTATARSSRS